ncbi:hypothetical protein K0M31_008965 [Melipona bicolor]|uniref:Uncharacterized protein n=1 Tax=Melipona bicolor TaxID=60889 RepID=A0AA40KKG1_9HYME|nr:hypothetical protein K0M31_008965 [Melipona bicolor]
MGDVKESFHAKKKPGDFTTLTPDMLLNNVGQVLFLTVRRTTPSNNNTARTAPASVVNSRILKGPHLGRQG